MLVKPPRLLLPLCLVAIAVLAGCASDEPRSVDRARFPAPQSLAPLPKSWGVEAPPVERLPIPAHKPAPPKAFVVGYSETGVASWYGRPFHGRRTASGRIYDMYAMTAAHKKLPLGTKLRVTNLANRRSTVVIVNDRGPYVKGRIIDVSMRVAGLLGFKGKGLAKVRLEIIGEPKGRRSRRARVRSR